MPSAVLYRRAAFILTAAAVATIPTQVHAQSAAPEAPQLKALSELKFRELGPAVMGGRVADLAVNEQNAAEFYVGFATGGLWKTSSHGANWTPLFDDQPNASIGDVTLAPSNPNILWVGTGEPQNRQSSPWGDGVYKSVDGGRTWTHMGLTETRHISRIAIHPRNPDVVYVAAVGHLWGPNPERGVFKTTDGGETWSKILYQNENTGAIDLVMDPGDPNTLFAAMYQRRRTPWGFSASGPGSGLYRTLDGGKTWTELKQGLPTGDKGRIGLDVYRRDGNLVYAVIEANRKQRGIYRSKDRGETWEKVSDRNPRPMYFSLLRIDPNDPERIYLGGVQFSISNDGGKTWLEGDQAEGIHVDHHALWIDPSNSNHVILGNDGGVATSWDRGEHWRYHNNLAVGQFYQVGVDMRDPYWVCGGLQDNSNWCGPSESLDEEGIRNEDWFTIWGGDGFYNKPDPTNPNIVYTESQGGNFGRYHIDTGEAARLRPSSRAAVQDTTKEYRWNWNTPIHISHHDPKTVYVAGNHVLRSRDRGLTWEEASPDLTRRVDRDTMRIMGALVDSLTLSRNDGVSDYGTITSLAESPLDPNLIYAGTDDGVLQVTRDGGATWTDLTRNVPGLGHGFVVSSIEPSRAAAGRVYLAFDGHYSDDYGAYVFVSEDFGRRWRRITEGLPAWSVNVVREHPRTPELLFLGNEVALYLSFDRGARWDRLDNNLPTVPVDDIVLHPRENDLVLGTHGRSIWILDDVAPLEAMTRATTLASAAELFPVRPATRRSRAPGWEFRGDEYAAPNPPVGARIRYYLGADLAPAGDSVRPTVADNGDNGERASSKANAEAKAKITILDSSGRVIRKLEGAGKAGVQEVIWDLRMDAPYETPDTEEMSWRNRPPRGALVLPGTYTARLEAAGKTLETPVVVREDPRIKTPVAELQARQTAMLSLNALAKPVYDAGQHGRTIDERIKAVQKLLKGKDGSKALLEEADSLAKQLQAARDSVSQVSRAGFLGFALESISASPTADQMWQIDQMWERAPSAIVAMNEVAAKLAELEAKVFQPAARPKPIEAIEVPPRP